MNDSSRQDLLPRPVIWLLLAGVLIGVAAIRYRLLGLPLERDEGEYAYGAQLLLQGLAPYKHLFTMKMPGIFAIYAASLSLFGQNVRAVHLGLLLANTLTILLCYLLGRQVVSRMAGIGAAFFFAVLSLLPAVHGMFANTEHFVLVPVLLGLLLLLRSLENEGKQWLAGLSGLLLGLAFCIKQHAVTFFLCGLIMVGLHFASGKSTAREGKIRALLIYAAGAALPVLATFGILLAAGVFRNFWFWTVKYAGSYASAVTWRDGLQALAQRSGEIAAAAPLLWLGAAAGLIFFPLARLKKDKLLFFLIFFFISFLAVCPGLYFRPHYFVLFLPAAALAFGLCLEIIDRTIAPSNASRTLRAGIALGVAVAASSLTLYQQRTQLFFMMPDQLSREIYWPNPFVESVEIAKIIESHTNPQDTVAVFGSEPQLFFYSHRKSATGFIYMYPLMEKQPYALQMQQDLMRQVELQQPKILVFVRNQFSWQWNDQSLTAIFDWYKQYSRSNYTRIGMVDIFSDMTNYSWEPQVAWPPQSPFWIEIMERNEM